MSRGERACGFTRLRSLFSRRTSVDCDGVWIETGRCGVRAQLGTAVEAELGSHCVIVREVERDESDGFKARNACTCVHLADEHARAAQ